MVITKKSKKVHRKEESEETQVAKFETVALKIGDSISYVKGRKLVRAERVKAILSSRTRSQTPL